MVEKVIEPVPEPVEVPVSDPMLAVEKIAPVRLAEPVGAVVITVGETRKEIAEVAGPNGVA